ncbi:MAG TPA: alpha/beta hydrolase [Candidatus Dormibacteraeota bacterium]
MTGEDFDLQLPSGRLHLRRFGSAEAPLALCVPGISANLCGFDYLGERLGGAALQVVAVDLRGRGLSEVTPPGTYGPKSHATDLLAIADALGADRFSLIGQSSGALISMLVARQAGDRVERVALLDLCGAPDDASVVPVEAAIQRLDAVFPSVDGYIELFRSRGVISDWSEYWERYLRYELKPVEGGVRARSEYTAVWEDHCWHKGMLTFGDDSAIYRLWQYLTMPVLLLYAQREIIPGFGYITPPREWERFPAEVPTARAVGVDANHYEISTHDSSARAMADFFQVAVTAGR